jgi:hypothetical protein
MVHIYSPVTTARLQYVLGVIFRDHLRVPYRLSADRRAWEDDPGPKINYTTENLPGGVWITPSGLLSEQFAHGRAPVADALRGARPMRGAATPDAPLSGDGPRAAPPEDAPWPFDLFGAIFYLLSRYEEYVPDAVYDHYGRFDPDASWAGRQGWLERPLVDEWIGALGTTLGLTPPAGTRFSPTYDIDQPWCYQHKGLKTNTLTAAKALLTGRWGQVGEQGKVLGGRLRDPFDNFDWMDRVNREMPESAVYFFPLSATRNAYDKNPSPGHAGYQTLIREHSARYPVGLHPSFYSTTTPGLLASEVALLSRITGLPVTISRFHYIRFRLPEGYRLLLDCGIRADYSMGYGERNGFRASYSRPFPWYDLENETETALQVVPFCWMEATSYHNRGLDAGAALAELNGYRAALDPVGGRLTVIWHNNSLGDTPRWIGWRSVYKDFLTPIVPTLPS